MSELEELPSWAGRSVSNTPDGDPSQKPEPDIETKAATTTAKASALGDQAADPTVVQAQYIEPRRRRPFMMFLLGFLGLLALVAMGVLGYLLAQSQDSSETETAGQTTEDTGEDQLGSETSDSADPEAEEDGAATAGTDTEEDGTTEDGAEEDGESAQLTVDTESGNEEDGATEDTGADDTGSDDAAAETEDGTTEDGAEAPENDRQAIFRAGKLYLSGSVPSEEVSQLIEERAGAVVGPDNVINEYVIDPTVVIEAGSSAPLYVEDVVLFEFNSIEVATPFLPILDLGTLLLRQNPQASVTVVTRTDAVGSEAVNLDVSTKRAQAVINYWLGKGVNPSQIKADPRGEEGASESDDEETAALNRRAEFIITGLLD